MHCNAAKEGHPNTACWQFEPMVWGVDYDQYKDSPYPQYGLVYSLSEGDITKEDVILDKPCEVVYQYYQTKRELQEDNK